MITSVGDTYFSGRVEANQALFGAQLYLALSTDTAAPAAADTVIAAEVVGQGLQRQAAALAHTAGQKTWTLSATFTFTGGAAVTITKVALFDAPAGGNLIAEALIPAVTYSVAGDNAPFSFALSL